MSGWEEFVTYAKDICEMQGIFAVKSEDPRLAACFCGYIVYENAGCFIDAANFANVRGIEDFIASADRNVFYLHDATDIPRKSFSASAVNKTVLVGLLDSRQPADATITLIPSEDNVSPLTIEHRAFDGSTVSFVRSTAYWDVEQRLEMYSPPF